MKEGHLWCHTPVVTEERAQRRPVFNIDAGWISAVGRSTSVCCPSRESSSTSSPRRLTADALRTLARRIDGVYGEPVCAVVESMTGARFVHDTLEQEGWDVEFADAQKVKGLAPLA